MPRVRVLLLEGRALCELEQRASGHTPAGDDGASGPASRAIEGQPLAAALHAVGLQLQRSLHLLAMWSFDGYLDSCTSNQATGEPAVGDGDARWEGCVYGGSGVAGCGLLMSARRLRREMRGPRAHRAAAADRGCW